MNCRMERNSRLFDVLSLLKTGYRTGDFTGLFPCLAEDCVWESQWVLSSIAGYDAIVSYLTGKGKTLAGSGCFPACSIVELLGNCSPVRNAVVTQDGRTPETASVSLLYEPGKLCLYMEQTINNETSGVIVDVTLDDDGMVKRIDLCMPELFRYREFYTYVAFYPANDGQDEEYGEHKDRKHLVRVSEPYYEELYLFLSCAGVDFDEYDDLHIPMESWCRALSYWRSFLASESFDEAFELVTGVDYKSGTVRNTDAAKRLGRAGKRLWEDRETSRIMLDGLIEWTALYKCSYTFINTYGW